VPLDHDQPGGRQIGIALNRRRATNTAGRIGSLLINPGGPGASGVDIMPDLLDRISTEVKGRFDIVGFDPRGTGQSSPISCLPDADLAAYFAVDPTPDDAAEKAALIQSTQKFVAGCQQRSGELLPHVGTEDAVRDMDLIRAAVGDEKLSYLGFSYGTSLGATYAELFPNRVRALVLDGAVDQALDTPALNRVQGEGFDRAFDAFVADCAAKGTTCAWKPAGGPSKQAYLAVSARVDAQPLTAGSRRVGPSEFLLGSAALLYSQSTWPVLARGLAQAETGTGTLIQIGFDTLVNRNPDGSFGNDQEANAAINCMDNPAPKDLDVYERLAAEAARTAPAFGPAIAWSGLVCALWPVPPTGRAEPLKVSGAPPILVVGTTNDPATPFVWAEAMASQIPGSRLLRHEGEGHTAYGEDTCTTRIADGYLLGATLPPGQLKC
jgi:pimeloyl-ACP methyl ester carboxylesterase